jgi:O-antigen ligase
MDWALEVGAVLVLAVRPTLDFYSERRFGLGVFATNPSIVVGLIVLGVATVSTVRRGSLGLPLWPDPGLRRVHALLFAACGVGVLSGLRLYGRLGLAEGLREAVRVLSTVAALLVVWWWASAGERYRRGWTYLVIGSIVPIMVALQQFNTGRGFSDIVGINRVQGTFSHPNAFSQYLVPFVLVSVAEFNTRRGIARLSLGLAALGLTGLIALSYTRTAILALVLGLVAIPVLQVRRFKLRTIVRAISVVIVFLAVAWLATGNLIRERFSTLSIGRAALEASQIGQSENSFEWRLVNWGILISMGLQHPIVGHGAGMTTVLNPLVAENGIPFNAHDDFVRFFFEGGAVGLALYSLYAILLCRWVIRRSRSIEARFAATGAAVAAAFLSLFLLTGGTTEISLQTADLFQLCGILALVAALPVDAEASHQETATRESESQPWMRGEDPRDAK